MKKIIYYTIQLVVDVKEFKQIRKFLNCSMNSNNHPISNAIISAAQYTQSIHESSVGNKQSNAILYSWASRKFIKEMCFNQLFYKSQYISLFFLPVKVLNLRIFGYVAFPKLWPLVQHRLSSWFIFGNAVYHHVLLLNGDHCSICFWFDNETFCHCFKYNINIYRYTTKFNFICIVLWFIF